MIASRGSRRSDWVSFVSDTLVFLTITIFEVSVLCSMDDLLNLRQYPRSMSTIYVAHFGHPLLKGAKHWAIILIPSTSSDLVAGTAYQISGGTETYELKTPEYVDLLGTPEYMGRINIGTITAEDGGRLREVLDATPVRRGFLDWNCQNWVVEGLKRLADGGILHVDEAGLVLTLGALRERLEGAKREDGKWN